MTRESDKTRDAVVGEAYRQARGQTAARTSYDVQAGLARLNDWLLQDGPGSSPPGHAGSALFDAPALDNDPAPQDEPSSRPSQLAAEHHVPKPTTVTYGRSAVTAVTAVTAGQADEQGLLFGEELAEETGYRGPTACSAAGITYRQLDYWARTGLVEPSVRPAQGSGTQRLYSFRDILVLKVVKRLLETGISLQQIRTAVQHLRDRGSRDLAQVTLMSDGMSVYECTSTDEVVDLLQGGQGVFGIALGKVWHEVEGCLAELPGIRVERGEPSRDGRATDELAARRARQTG
jgi:DNA-binding transcriptional MerR regulator